MFKKNKRLILFAIILLAILGLKSTKWMAAVTQVDLLITYLRAAGSDYFLVTALLYTAVTVIGSVLLALPGITFAILASALFPPFLATVLCAFAATVGAGIAFLVGRFFLKDSLSDFAKRSEILNRFLFKQTLEHPVRLLMITRLVPIFPFNIQNFAYGMTDIAFKTYLWSTFVFIIPGTAMYTYGMSGILTVIKDGASRSLKLSSMKYFGITIIAAILVYWVSKYLNRKYVENHEDDSKVLGNMCTSCGLCTSQCAFLNKYDMDFKDVQKLKSHAYECFLCGRCRAVCPEKVDGRQIMLDLRRNLRQEKPSSLWRYANVIGEKRRYLFGNKVGQSQKSLIYWGCNFPSLYPKTTEKLMALMALKGTASIFDCCGKPIEELGLQVDANHIVEKLNERLQSMGTEELVFVCPNCDQHLRGKLSVRMVNVYDKLKEMGIEFSELEVGHPLFPPCPDRVNGQWFQSIAPYLPEATRIIKEPQCCGAGGCGGVGSPEIAKAFRTSITDEALMVYCATCAGEFGRGKQTKPKHILSEILGVHEGPALGFPLGNRIKFKFK